MLFNIISMCLFFLLDLLCLIAFVFFQLFMFVYLWMLCVVLRIVDTCASCTESTSQPRQVTLKGGKLVGVTAGRSRRYPAW